MGFTGGHVEPGEDPEEALVRELTEELGVVAGRLVARYEAEVPGARLTVFSLRDWTGEPVNAAPAEHERVGWFTASEVAALDLADERLAVLVRDVLADPVER